MKAGVCYGVIDEGHTFEEKLAAAHSSGYEGIELVLGIDRADPLSLGLDSESLFAVRRTVERAQLEIPSVMGGPALAQTPLLSFDPGVRQRSVGNYALALETVATLGASTVLMHPGQLRAETRYDQAWEWVVQALRDLVPACERTGVSIGLENVWNKFLLSPREFAQLLDEVNHPLIGCYLDTANMLLYGYAEQWVEIIGRRIKKVHVKDFKRERGGGRFCQLLSGDCNFPRVMAELRAVRYDDYLTSEVSPSERSDGETMRDTAERIREITLL